MLPIAVIRPVDVRPNRIPLTLTPPVAVASRSRTCCCRRALLRSS